MTDQDPEPDPTPRDEAFAGTIARSRPAPPAGFRGALARHLTAQDPGYGPRPERLLLLTASLLAAGLVILLVALLQATGSL